MKYYISSRSFPKIFAIYLVFILFNNGAMGQLTYSTKSPSSVGVGATDPRNKFEIWSNLTPKANTGLDFAFGNTFGTSYLHNDKKFAIWRTISNPIVLSPKGTNALLVHPFGINIGSTIINPAFSIHVMGNGYISEKLLIGTTDFNKITGYKLAVNGAALFNKVMIKNYAVWPDFVFDEGYALPSLSQLSRYLKKHKHLPDIPSSREINKNDVDVAQLLAMQLQKIEELTLYIIDLEKRIKKLEK